MVSPPNVYGPCSRHGTAVWAPGWPAKPNWMIWSSSCAGIRSVGIGGSGGGTGAGTLVMVGTPEPQWRFSNTGSPRRSWSKLPGLAYAFGRLPPIRRG